MQTQSLPQAVKAQRDKGFTLIELLVVVVIIGILAAVAIPVFLNQRAKASEAGIKSDLKNTATLQETYMVDKRTYAATAAALTGFQQSDTNTISVLSGDATKYCLKGISTGTDEVWYYNSTTGGLTKTACT